jgi:hypothetical protein
MLQYVTMQTVHTILGKEPASAPLLNLRAADPNKHENVLTEQAGTCQNKQ